MKMEANIPNIVVDDNYRMLVNRLTRRYAERGASVYTDAEAIEQERSDARARAIAPDAYRISRTLGDNPEMYKSGDVAGARYMTTDDYLVYFSKCHDTFDAVNYYSLHSEAPVVEDPEESQPRVLVNRKRLEMMKKNAAGNAAPRKRRTAAADVREPVSLWDRLQFLRRKAVMAVAAATASLAVVVAGVFALIPADEATNPDSLSEDGVMSVAEYEGQDVLQNVE